MKDQGDLGKGGLGYLVTRLVNREEPVRLTVETDRRTYVLFVDGAGIRIDNMHGEGFATDLEEVLLHENRIDENELLEVLSERFMTGRPTEDILEERDTVPKEELDRFCVKRVEDELLLVLSLTEGTYTVEPLDRSAAEASRDPRIPASQFDIEALTGAALDRMERFDSISKDFRNEGEFFLALEKVSGDEGLEEKVLASLQGDKPLKDVVPSLGLAPFKVHELVNQLVQNGRARPLTLEELREGARNALEKEDLVSALAFLRRAFDRQRDEPEIVRELADLFEYAMEQKTASAFQSYLGALHVKGDEGEKAEAAWEKAVELDPGNLAAWGHLFQRRRRAGAGSAAIETGLQRVHHAIEAGKPDIAEETLGELLEENPDHFGLRKAAFEVRFEMQDAAGAMEQASAMERITDRGGAGEEEAGFLPYAFQKIATLDPGNPEIAAKVEAARKAVAPRKKTNPLLLAFLGLLVVALAGAGALYHFVFARTQNDGGGGRTPAGASVPAQKPGLAQAKARVEEAEGFLAAGEMEKALKAYRQALEATDKKGSLAETIRGEIEKTEKEIRLRLEKRIAKTVEETRARIQSTLEAGRKAQERGVEKAQAAIQHVLDGLPALRDEAPETFEEDIGQIETEAKSALQALNLRMAQVLFLRGELEWDKDEPDAGKAKNYFQKAARYDPEGSTARAARRMCEEIDAYLLEADRIRDALEKTMEALRAREGPPPPGVIEEALKRSQRLWKDFSKSPRARDVRFPVWVDSEPTGARITLEGEEEGARTPALLFIPAGATVPVRIHKKGFETGSLSLDGTRTRVTASLRRGLIWMIDVENTVERGPAGDGRRLFLSCRDGTLRAFDVPAEGNPEPAWPPFRVGDIGGIRVRPTLWNETILFGSATLGNLYALDASSGKKVWGPFKANRMVAHPPVVRPGAPVLLAGDVGGMLYAIDAGAGTLLWKTRLTPAREGVRSAPVVVPEENAILVGTSRGNLLKVGLEDGAPVWRVATGFGTSVGLVRGGAGVLAVVGSRVLSYEVGGSDPPAGPVWTLGGFFAYSMPVPDGETIHLTDRNGVYHAIRARDGSHILRFSFGAEGQDPIRPFLAGRGRVILASGAALSAWRREAGQMQKAWEIRAPAPINDPLLSHGGTVVFTTSDGHLCAVLLD